MDTGRDLLMTVVLLSMLVGRESRTSFFAQCNLNFFPLDKGCPSHAKLCLM